MDIEELHKRYRETNKDEVIKEGDSVSFAEVKTEINRIYSWENDYYQSAEYRNQLPEETKRTIENNFETVLRQFEEIVDLRAKEDITTLATQKTGRITNIQNLYKVIYESFNRDYRGWKLENQGTQYTQVLENIVKEAQETQKSLSSRASRAKAKTSEIQQSAKASVQATQTIGLSELAKFFNQLVNGENDWIEDKKNKKGSTKWYYKHLITHLRGYAGGARIWFIFSLASFTLTGFIAYFSLSPFIRDITTNPSYSNKPPSFIFADLIAKSLILIAPIYLIRFCLKNYGANKHLAADALHKAKTLQTLSAYLAITKNDKAATREISVTVARLVFNPINSGFTMNKDDLSSPDININPGSYKIPS